jgi:alpha,alpha-trehalase
VNTTPERDASLTSDARLVTIDPADFDAMVFDMDGVVTETATVHAAAWKSLFDDFLAAWAAGHGTVFRPFDIEDDYLTFVDGKPRFDGVRDFLASRRITIPYGAPSDPPDRETVCGLGNRKNDRFLETVRQDGVRAFPGTVRLIGELHAAGVRTAIISASENAAGILAAAGVERLFATVVDGSVAHRLGLPGKPDPAVFLEAARQVDAAPPRTAVAEDALAGVAAGRSGGFGLVIGVDRTAVDDRMMGGDRTTEHAIELRRHGADVVVRDLADIGVRRLGCRPDGC